MLESSQLYKPFKLLFISFFIISFQACSSVEKPELCGDLLTSYAEKPANLTFLKCKKGKGQTVVVANYSVSDQNANEVEDFLVKRYGLMKFSDYYHSMPMNEVYLSPKKLLEKNANYSLLIGIENKNMEKNPLNKTTIKNKSFLVYVKILDI